MADKLRLEVLLSAVDKVTAPLRNITQGSKKTAQAVGEAVTALKKLQSQQRALAGFKQASDQMRATRQQLQSARAALAELAVQTHTTQEAQRAHAAQMKAAQAVVQRLSISFDKQTASVRRARAVMQERGITDPATAEARLAAQVEKTTQAIRRQQAARERLQRLERTRNAMAVRGAAMTGAGYGLAYGGQRALHALGGPLGQGRNSALEELRIRALGLEQSQAEEAIGFAREFKAYGNSTVDNLALMRDAITVFNDVHHARDAMPLLTKMKFANEATFGAEHGEEQDKKFMDMLKVIEMRNGANNRTDFERNANLVQQVITATGGRVGADDWLQLIKTGGVAAKGIGEKEFFYRLEPLVQEMGGFRLGTGMMSAYQNIYQGKTTKRAAVLLDQLGLIADPSKVKHDKVGQVAQLGVGALKGAELFQKSQFQWMEKVLLPALASHGLTSEKQVLDAMGGIFSNRSAAQVFATMYQQRAMINKSYALNERADNVDTLYGRSQGTPQGRELELRARKNALYERLGSAVMPGYVALLQMLTRIVEGVNRLATEYPMLTKALGYGAAIILGTATALGVLLIPMGVLLAKGALLRWVLARMGFSLFGAGAAAAAAAPAMGLLYRAGFMLGRAFVWLKAAGSALLIGLRAVAAFLIANPIVFAIALLATAAYMLYSRWDDVVGGFKLLMQDIGAAVSGAAQYVMGLGARFFDAGAAIMQGMYNGITSRLGAVRDAIGSAATGAIDWFKEKLGINSPSRVFMQLGSYVGEGAALGIRQGAGLVRGAAIGMAGAAMVPMAAMAGAGAAPAGPMATASTYQITINAAPGMDQQAIARAVASELDRRERAQASRRYSRLDDID